MALYAIADLHLSLGEEKPMDIFRGWTNYIDRLTRNWTALVQPADTVVVAGDVSWAMSLDGARTDSAFLDRLPGRKLLLKGNHDYWWNTRRKMDAFLAEQGFDSIRILHNSAERYGPWALCGSRGWFFDAEADARGRPAASVDRRRTCAGRGAAGVPALPARHRCGALRRDDGRAAPQRDHPVLVRPSARAVDPAGGAGRRGRHRIPAGVVRCGRLHTGANRVKIRDFQEKSKLFQKLRRKG